MEPSPTVKTRRNGRNSVQRLTALLGATLVVWRKTLQNEQTTEGFFQSRQRSVTRRKAKLKKLK